MPPSEVGLVFCATGKTLGMINSSLFPTVDPEIIVTTLLTQPLLILAMYRDAIA